MACGQLTSLLDSLEDPKTGLGARLPGCWSPPIHGADLRFQQLLGVGAIEIPAGSVFCPPRRQFENAVGQCQGALELVARTVTRPGLARLHACAVTRPGL